MGLAGQHRSVEDTPGPGHYKLPESMAQKDRCPIARQGTGFMAGFVGLQSPATVLFMVDRFELTMGPLGFLWFSSMFPMGPGVFPVTFPSG